jgi:hypothetical protein
MKVILLGSCATMLALQLCNVNILFVKSFYTYGLLIQTMNKQKTIANPT